MVNDNTNGGPAYKQIIVILVDACAGATGVAETKSYGRHVVDELLSTDNACLHRIQTAIAEPDQTLPAINDPCRQSTQKRAGPAKAISFHGLLVNTNHPA